MANTTGNDRLSSHPWNLPLALRRQYAIPNSNTTFYSGQLVGRDASGDIVQADDTSKYELVGIVQEILRETVYTGDSLGDKLAQMIERPLVYTSLIASAAAGDEGRMVFVLYNNQVSYSPGSNANFAGWIWRVKDSTHVDVLAPWANHITAGNNKGIFTTGVSGSVTLTKWDIHKTIAMPLTGSLTVNLPAASSVGPGDEITFLNTGSASSVPTLTPNGADTINGSASLTMSAVQYATLTVRSNGADGWYSAAQNVSGTLGATTFTDNVGLTSATLIIADNDAQTFAVGPNGGTHPCFQVECDVSSAASGLNVIGRAAGAGVSLQVITSGTNEDLLIAPAGSGAVKITTTGAAGLTVGPNGATNPTFQVVCNVSSEATGLKITGAAAASGLALAVVSSGTDENLTVNAKGAGTITLGSASTGNVLFAQNALVNVAAKSLGYGTGAGGAVTQITSRTTGVTLSKATGQITLVSAAGSGTAFTFTVTNTLVVATDTIIVNQVSGTDAYSAVVSAVGSGSYKLTITDLTGTTTEQPVFNVNLIKGVSS